MAHAPATRRLDPARGGMTLLLGALIAHSPLAMDIYLASMPSMTHALDATPAEVQLTLSVYMLAWGVAQLFGGPLSDRFGRRPALLGGLVLFTAASLACASAQGVAALVAARAVQAIAMATVAVVPRAVVRDLYAGTDAAHMLSLMGMVLGIAPIVAPIIGSHLHVWFGWQANFLFVAAYAAVLVAFVASRLPETLAARDSRALAPAVLVANYRRLLSSRVFVGYTLVAAFGASGLFAFLAGSSFVFVQVMGQGEQGFGYLFGAVMLGNLSGATIGARVVRRWGLDRTIGRALWVLVAGGVAAAGLAWAGITHPLAVVVPMFAYMFALMMTMPQAAAGALTPHPRIAGAASSVLSFVQFVVASMGALVVGVTFDGTVRPMATTVAVSALLAAAAFVLLVRPARAAASHDAA
jgi:DHA1 family bicyclomycin/chloramphenicol resistance-like MFS transporter